MYLLLVARGRALIGEGHSLERGAYWGGALIGKGCLLGRGTHWKGVLIREGMLISFLTKTCECETL